MWWLIIIGAVVITAGIVGAIGLRKFLDDLME